MIKAYAAFEPGGHLRPFEYDPGKLKDDEVEINVEFCGVCHSDLSMVYNEWGMTEYPIVPGHEVVGKVAAVGKDVNNVSIGDSVGLGWHSGYCMTCTSCMSGDHNLCSSAQPTIIKHHGGFADKVRAASPSVIKLPAGIDPVSTGPLFCGGITVFNPLIQFGVKSTDKAAVIGIGGLGHMALQFLNAWGCEVTAFTSNDKKAQEAMEMGACHVINSRDPDALEEAAGSFDIILSTVNVTLDWDAYINTLKPRGRLHLIGALTDGIKAQMFPLLMAQRSISGSPVGSPVNIAKMLDFAVQHDIKPVIEKYDMADLNEAMDRLKSGQAHYRIVLCN